MESFYDKLKINEFFRNGYLINGEWRDATQHYAVINPATEDTITQVAYVGQRETEEAIAAAAEAFLVWRKTTAKQRSDILQNWFQLIIANKIFLAELMVAEQGKPLREALVEVDYAASFIRWFAEEAKRANGEIIPPVKPGSRIWATREPVGVIVAITPWNFPLAMLTRKLGPALAAGCTSVIKPANETPLSAFALLALAQKAGVPNGVINAVSGDTLAISDVVMASQQVRKITFTGSTAVGKILVRNAADTMKKVSMELGGNAPFIVFDDADFDTAIEGIMANKFRNAGQVCVCINRIYIHNSIYDRFVECLAQRISQLKVGNGMDTETHVGPLVLAKNINKIENYIDDALAKGGKVVVGGKRLTAQGSHFFSPTLITEANDTMKMASEELFAPVAACYRFSSEDEVIQRANATSFGLAAYFYTQDLSRIFRVSEAIESGMIGINESSLSSEIAPFGGIKESGLGREGSVLGLEEYLQVKTLHLGNLSS